MYVLNGRKFLSSKALSEEDTGILRKEAHQWTRAQKEAAFADGPRRIDGALRKFPRPMWNFTSRKGFWTITQVLWHLADQEANLYVRLRKAAAEPGQFVTPYDQEKWSQKLFYSKASPEQARDLVLILRKANMDLLRRLPAAAWKSKVRQPEWGSRSLEFMVALNVWHLEHHIRQMERRFREWSKT